MNFLFLTIWSVGMLVLARWLCGRWFNHLTLYTTVWSASLATLFLGLIHYHAIVLEAYVYIFVAWSAVYLGTAVVRLGPKIQAPLVFPPVDMKRLRIAIVLLAFAGFTSSFYLARNIVRALNTEGILVALTNYANDIYRLRFEGEVSGLMYLTFFPYAGCVLAGIYTARVGRITVIGLLPTLALLVDAILSMQKGAIFIGSALSTFAWLLTPKTSGLHVPRWQKLAIIGTILGVCVFIWMHREGASVFEGETEALAKAGDTVSVTPILYLSVSGPIACFSDYLKHPDEDGKALWGRYMFGSIYRFLAKLGLDTYVPYYQTFYYTPAEINVGTYLRELHRDFGATALFIFPFLLGLTISALQQKAPTPESIVILTFLYLEVSLSFNVNFISGGAWYFPFPIALLAAHLVRLHPSQPRRLQNGDLLLSACDRS